MSNNGKFNRAAVARAASELYCERAKEAGREKLCLTIDVYGPNDVDCILSIVRESVTARLEEMKAEARKAEARWQAKFEEDPYSMFAESRHSTWMELRHRHRGAQEVARLLGVEVHDEI